MTPSPQRDLLLFLSLLFFVESVFQGRLICLAVWAYNGSVRRDPSQQLALLGRYQSMAIAFLSNFVGLGASWFYKLIIVAQGKTNVIDIDEAMNAHLDSWAEFLRQFLAYEMLFRIGFVLFVIMALVKIALDATYVQAIRITLNYLALLTGTLFAIVALFGLPVKGLELMAWLFPS